MKHVNLDLTDLGLQALTSKPGFKEALTGEQDLSVSQHCRGRIAGPPSEQGWCGYLPSVLLFFCVVSEAKQFTERGKKPHCDTKTESSSIVLAF